MHKTLSSSFMILWAVSATAPAATIDLTCGAHFGGSQTRCSLSETALTETPGFEAAYELSYKFPCSGHQTGLEFQTDGSREPVGFTTSEATVRLSGHRPVVVVNQDPPKTYRAILVGDCRIEVTGIKVAPSGNQLTNWQNEARSQIRIITLALTRLQTSKRFDQVVSWNDSQLRAARDSLERQLLDLLPQVTFEQLIYPLNYPDPELRGRLKAYDEMPQAWKDTVIFHPELPDIVTMLSQVRAIIDGRPPVYSPDDTQRFKDELRGEATTGMTMFDRLTRWQGLLAPEMNQTRVDLKAACDRAAAEIQR